MSGRFLSLPLEIRQIVYKHLLKVDSVTSIQHRRSYHLSPAVLRVCQQIYHEALKIFRSNNFVRLTYSGPCDFAPEYAMIRLQAASQALVSAAGGMCADVDISVHSNQADEVIQSRDILTRTALAEFWRYLHARQIRSVPIELIRRALLRPEPDDWRVSINVRAFIPVWEPATLNASIPRSSPHTLLRKADFANVFGTYTHPDNNILIAHQGPDMVLWNPPATTTITWATLQDWLGYAFGVLLLRKQQIDLALTTPCEPSQNMFQYLADLYRNLCLDLQDLAECSELVHTNHETEALGIHRGPIMTLMGSSFYCYAYLNLRFRTVHPVYWPFQRSCAADICVCHALVQTDADIMSTYPSQDLNCSHRYWAHLRHLAAVIHLMHDTSGDKDTEQMLAKLQAIQGALPDDSNIRHDLDVFANAVNAQDVGHLVSNTSFFVRPLQIMEGNGQMRASSFGARKYAA